MAITKAAMILIDCRVTDFLRECPECWNRRPDRFAFAKAKGKSGWVRTGCTACAYAFMVDEGLFEDAELEMLPTSDSDDFTSALDARRNPDS